jgi:hypothetical protein
MITDNESAAGRRHMETRLHIEPNTPDALLISTSFLAVLPPAPEGIQIRTERYKEEIIVSFFHSYSCQTPVF